MKELSCKCATDMVLLTRLQIHVFEIKVFAASPSKKRFNFMADPVSSPEHLAAVRNYHFLFFNGHFIFS